MNDRPILYVLAIALIALMLPALAEEMPVAQDERLSSAILEDEGAVTRAQRRLIELGYLEGRADGIAGSRTADALFTFQTLYGLRATGYLDGDTLALLESDLPSPVQSIQQRLIDLGYLAGSADGLWGPRSSAALQLFQRLNGLSPTGTIDEATMEALNGSTAAALPGGVYSGDRGEAVEALQSTLIRLGFLNGRADGIYGEATAAAVLAFQRHLSRQGLAEGYGIEATGEATTATMYLLNLPDYSTYIEDIQSGDTGDEVRRIENRLNQLGYMDMPADDELDDYALSALDLFRAQAGLPEQSSIGREDVDRLFAQDAPIADHCAPHDIALGDSGIMVREAEAALVRGGMTIKLPNGVYDEDVAGAVGRVHSHLEKLNDEHAQLFSDPNALSTEALEWLCDHPLGYVSQEGESEALRIQRRLHTLYYLSRDGVDGRFGSGSREALSQFQAANGLEATGVADEDTQNLLFSDSAVAKPLKYRLEVSIARQRVEAYALGEDGAYRQVQSFICSTGLNNSTPRGIFLDGFPVNRWHYFSKYYCWAQYSYEIEGNYMFHSVLYSSNDESTLKTSSVYNLGGPASHGCIRLEVEAAQWIFEHCERGTTVIIID